MTDNRINPDDYGAMTNEQLREVILMKQGAVNDVLRRNQELEGHIRGHLAEIRTLKATVESMNRRERESRAELMGVMAERENAIKFGGALFDKLREMGTYEERRPRDLQKLARLLFHSIDAVSRISAWPELSAQDFFNKLFTTAEERVFGTPGPKKKANVKEFVDRSLAKKVGRTPPTF